MKLQKLGKLLSLGFAVLTAFSVLLMTSCEQKENPASSSSGVASVETQAEDLWADAVYTEDKTFGEGAKSVDVEVKAADKSITFTLKTDKENLADALLEHKLVEGEDGPYGLYIKKVNGILADYDVNKAYWGLNKNGEMLMTGASDTKIADGEHYELVYAK